MVPTLRSCLFCPDHFLLLSRSVSASRKVSLPPRQKRLCAPTRTSTTMLTGRLLLRPGLVSCSRNTGPTLRSRQSPTLLLLDSSRRVFASTPRHRKDDAQARTPAAVELEKPKVDAKAAKDVANPAGPASATAKGGPLLAEQTVSNKEQRKADWAIIKDMAHYLWPKNDFSTRFRVGLSVGLLVGAKVRCPVGRRFSRNAHVDSFFACRSSMCRFHSISRRLSIQ